MARLLCACIYRISTPGRCCFQRQFQYRAVHQKTATGNSHSIVSCQLLESLADGMARLRWLEAMHTSAYGEEGVRFSTRRKAVMQRWSPPIGVGADFAMPVATDWAAHAADRQPSTVDRLVYRSGSAPPIAGRADPRLRYAALLHQVLAHCARYAGLGRHPNVAIAARQICILHRA